MNSAARTSVLTKIVLIFISVLSVGRVNISLSNVGYKTAEKYLQNSFTNATGLP